MPPKPTSFRAVLRVCLAAACLAAAASPAAAAIELRVTTDTPPNHVKNITLRAFIDGLGKATKGAVTGRLFESGQLFSARDEPKAVARGDIDMAVTTNASISAFVSDVNLLDTPLFSGIAPLKLSVLVDGPIGTTLAARIEKRLGVVVPGRWLLLGTTNTYGGRRVIKSYGDFQGARVRIPGGASYAARYRALGAEGVLIPFPDVPLALSQGTIDALLTTDETLRSAKLWESGVRSGFVDRVSVIVYIPMVSRGFWQRLSPEQQREFRAVWDSTVNPERVEAVRRQDQARSDNEKAGIVYYAPSPARTEAVNRQLHALVPRLARQLNIDPQLVGQATAAIGALP